MKRLYCLPFSRTIHFSLVRQSSTNSHIDRNLASKIKIAKTNGDFETANQLFTKAMERGSNCIDKYTINTMISVYGRQKQLKQVYKIFNLLPNPDLISFGSVFYACNECKGYQLQDTTTKFNTTDAVDVAWEIIETKLLNNNAISISSLLNNKQLGSIVHSP